MSELSGPGSGAGGEPQAVGPLLDAQRQQRRLGGPPLGAAPEVRGVEVAAQRDMRGDLRGAVHQRVGAGERRLDVTESAQRGHDVSGRKPPTAGPLHVELRALLRIALTGVLSWTRTSNAPLRDR
ncbi:hypothetical protein [Streptomyces mirabilis]